MRETAQVGKAVTRVIPAPLPWKGPSAQSNSCRYFPPFPALPTTLVELELLLGGQSVDLQKISSVIRRDPGFAAEIVRLSRSSEDQRPVPLETCLIHLGTRTLRRAARIVPVWIPGLSESEIWKLRWGLRRTRFVALAAETISALLGDISSEIAYLAGLLHELPALVCLSDGCGCSVSGIGTAHETWNLPDYLVETMRWYRQPVHAAPAHSLITFRVAAAREWVNEVQLSEADVTSDLDERVSQKALWRHMPHRAEVLQALAGKIEEWQHSHCV